MNAESDPEKPWSIMRRTAIGSVSVIRAAAVSDKSAPTTSLR
jgi:hypothetical protein